MNLSRQYPLALAAIMALVLVGCSERDPSGLETARARIDPVVYDDDFSDDVYFQPFFETHYTAMAQDSVYAYEGFAPDGARSIKFEIPGEGSALGPYTGGVLTSSEARDLADFNALTFYARTDAGTEIDLNVVGFGNDNTGTSLYEVGLSFRPVPLTGEWVFHIVPIPDSSKLISERGLFTISEEAPPAFPDGYNIWIDEIRFAKLDNIEIFRPMMTVKTGHYFIGATVAVTGARTIFKVNGENAIVDHGAAYYDYVSSDPSVAKVNRSTIEVVGEGESRLDAALQEVEVFGYVIVKGHAWPTVAAAPPTLPAANVISMFSDAYQDVNVDTWNADWGQAVTVEDRVVAGDNTKYYQSLNWAGIEFMNPTVDASAMTHIHLDVYAPGGTNFKVKLVSFPTDSDIEQVETKELVLDADSDPSFVAGTWASLDIPFTAFEIDQNPPGGTANDHTWDDWDWASIGLLVIVSDDATTVLLDNVYWHN